MANEQYIIFADSEMKGYLKDENSARRAVSDLADYLIEELKKNSNLQELRIFRENTDCGIKIYTQAIGQYINGAVVMHHTLSWKSIPEYKLPKTQ
jgi:hypothetical protein